MLSWCRRLCMTSCICSTYITSNFMTRTKTCLPNHKALQTICVATQASYPTVDTWFQLETFCFSVWHSLSPVNYEALCLVHSTWSEWDKPSWFEPYCLTLQHIHCLRAEKWVDSTHHLMSTLKTSGNEKQCHSSLWHSCRLFVILQHSQTCSMHTNFSLVLPYCVLFIK